MFLKGQYQDIIKYGQAKYEKEAFSEYFKEGIAMSVIASALMIDDYNLAFAYIDKLTLKKASQIKAVYYMDALILSGDNSKAVEVFSDFSDRKDPISIDIVVKYKPYFDFIAIGKPIDEAFLQTIKSPIQNKIYTKIRGKL